MDGRPNSSRNKVAFSNQFLGLSVDAALEKHKHKYFTHNRTFIRPPVHALVPRRAVNFVYREKILGKQKFYTLPSCHATLRREGITMLARVNTPLIVQFKNHNWSNPFLAHYSVQIGPY